MSIYYINSIFKYSMFFSPDLLNNDICTCSCWASVENWLLWRYASHSSLLYGGFRHLSNHTKFSCIPFGCKGWHFFYLGSPTYTHQPCADGFGIYTLLSEGLYDCSELNILTPFLPMGRGFQTKSKSKTCLCWLNGCLNILTKVFTAQKLKKEILV